jgi:hypothetical protein
VATWRRTGEDYGDTAYCSAGIQGAVLLETGRAPMESDVTAQPALAAMGRVAARILPRPTERGRWFASAEGTCVAGEMGITLPSSSMLYFAQILCVLALDGWYVAYEHEPDLYSMCVLFQRFWWFEVGPDVSCYFVVGGSVADVVGVVDFGC